MIGQRPVEHFRLSSFFGLFHFRLVLFPFVPGRGYQAILHQLDSPDRESEK